MTISPTVLNKTEEAAHTLATEVVTATLALQEAALQHQIARTGQERPTQELNELADFLVEHQHKGRADWSAQLWGSVYNRLSIVDLLDAGVLGAQSEQELEALQNPVQPASADGTAEHPVMVTVHGVAYPTVLDAVGEQRFVRNAVIAQLFTLAENSGVINLDHLRSMALNGHYTTVDLQAFVIQGLGFTVLQFAQMFPDTAVINPLWDDAGASPDLL